MRACMRACVLVPWHRCLPAQGAPEVQCLQRLPATAADSTTVTRPRTRPSATFRPPPSPQHHHTAHPSLSSALAPGLQEHECDVKPARVGRPEYAHEQRDGHGEHGHEQCRQLRRPHRGWLCQWRQRGRCVCLCVCVRALMCVLLLSGSTWAVRVCVCARARECVCFYSAGQRGQCVFVCARACECVCFYSAGQRGRFGSPPLPPSLPSPLPSPLSLARSRALFLSLPHPLTLVRPPVPCPYSPSLLSLPPSPYLALLTFPLFSLTLFLSVSLSPSPPLPPRTHRCRSWVEHHNLRHALFWRPASLLIRCCGWGAGKELSETQNEEYGVKTASNVHSTRQGFGGGAAQGIQTGAQGLGGRYTRLSEAQYARGEEMATNFYSTALQVEQWQQFRY